MYQHCFFIYSSYSHTYQHVVPVQYISMSSRVPGGWGGREKHTVCNIICVAITVYALSRSEAAAEESGLGFKRRGGVRMGRMRVGSRRMMGGSSHIRSPHPPLPQEDRSLIVWHPEWNNGAWTAGGSVFSTAGSDRGGRRVEVRGQAGERFLTSTHPYLV